MSPRGARPKQYPPELVAQVSHLYSTGLTQAEVAAATGLTQKVVFTLMRRHGIAARAAIPRNQIGDANGGWKDDAAGYSAMHVRVARARGKPSHCDECGTSDPSRRYEWANLTGHYEDVNDYKRMCVSCHRAYDNARRM